MKTTLKITTICLITFLASVVFAGVGGIGGGTTTNTIERDELTQILNSRNFMADLPQIPFYHEGFGTSFVSVDGVCQGSDEILETIQTFKPAGKFFGKRRAEPVAVVAQSLKTKRKYTVSSDKGDEERIISLEHQVQIYRLLGNFDSDRASRSFIGTKVYKIPACEQIRK